nr:hypothetical protein [Tanacetum cinerariifolium]
MGHRRSLPWNHSYRDMSLEFDGCTEYGRLRTRFSGDTALSRVSNLNTVFGKSKGHSLQRDIIITLCQLEMYFPPSFFDVMVHPVSHIVSEIKACGPIHLHYTYPFERDMGVVKGYVRNRYRPEGSIVEGYASEEVIEFYTNYLEGVKGIGVLQSHHVGRLNGVGTVGLKNSSPDHKLFEIAHFVVLEHMTCVAPYIHEHMGMLRVENIGRTETWYTKRHNEQFATWLKDKVTANMGQANLDKIVERLG